MIDELLVVHHTHTDIGFTHDQPVVWDLNRRFLDAAIDHADPDATGPSAFRWTVEATLPLLEWLVAADRDRVDRFLELERAGLVEVTAMPLNVTPLYGPTETTEGLRPVRTLREQFGVDVRTAMNCDVNGQNWPLADALIDAGIEGFSMAINDHFGGSPFRRPNVFQWEAPSGRTLPVLNGYHYMMGSQLRIGADADALADRWWPRLADHLDAVDLPFDVLPVQTVAFGDNGPPDPNLDVWIADWNDRPDVLDGDRPRIRMATPSDFWAAVDDAVDDRPVYRGDWTDFWNFGAGSSAREVALNRESCRRIGTADALAAGLEGVGTPLAEAESIRRPDETTRADAVSDLLLFDEHTWGTGPREATAGSDDARSMWHQKAAHAYRARSRSHLYRRDAIAELARHAGGDG